MDLMYVRKLVKLLSDSALGELEIEEDGRRIRLSKHSAGAVQVQQVPASASSAATGVPGSAAVLPAALASTPPEDASHYHEVKSPIVGTFYRSPAPDAAPFVQVGSAVSPGTVLCIVEAMKLMNEIESDVSGKIVKVLVENGQPVEYDQTLYLVETA